MTSSHLPLPTLPMQLMLSMGAWLSWPFALQCAKRGSHPLSTTLKNPLPGASAVQQKKLESALQEEAESRARSLLSGILRYAESPYARRVPEAPCIWQKGNARLLDYGLHGQTDPNQPIVVFVPSLINRYYILDLEEERSFVRFLASQGIYPLVLDWGTPGEFEHDFNCADYITRILNPAIDYIGKVSQQKIMLAGYCMGGVMALAAAKLRSSVLSGLALLATPWDFYCKEFAPFVLDSTWHSTLEELIASRQQLPSEVIHSLFYLTDPWIFEQKFRRFSALSPESRPARDFIALEQWVNDGVPMTAGVARDCLLGWAQQNTLRKNEWKVGGKVISPQSLRLPSFIAIPKSDHVVPYGCAVALAEEMPDSYRIHPGSGHVGMIVGTGAHRELWQPFAEWVRKTHRQ